MFTEAFYLVKEIAEQINESDGVINVITIGDYIDCNA
jgi:hypothetical protein